ncbi:MAG: KOW domain-containing RNA-binding protein [Clostridia bacterium]|nr:KOW domain-containing RNA-binding protein [Clostridia bacterium]
MEIRRGQIMRSLAGHDKGDFQTVLRVDGRFAYMADGKRRKLENPKKKKLIHLAPTGTVLSEERLSTNRQIRTALAEYREHTT